MKYQSTNRLFINGLITIFVLFRLVTVHAQTATESLPGSFENWLAGHPEITYKKIETTPPYKACYQLMIPQKINHFSADSETFSQRVYVSLMEKNAPVAMITEGYFAMRNYQSELAMLLQSNQVIVEHRYFSESTPENREWKYLTVEQAANDHHQIIELLKTFFDQSEWVTTGISKGGQTTIFHRYFFPDDVDASVPYVAPLNFSDEDERVYHFLDTMAARYCGEKLYAFQERLLKNKDVFMPMFEQFITENSLLYTIDHEAAFEYSVLEYEFAFWQWGYAGCDDIPTAAIPDSTAFQHFARIADPAFFSENNRELFQPFFYQALTQIGFYNYRTARLSNWIDAISEPTFLFLAPVDTRPEFTGDTLMRNIAQWLTTDAENILFIYGEFDAWSATAVRDAGTTNCVVMFRPEGSHRSRIRDFSADDRRKIYHLLEEWLDTEVKEPDK